MFRLVTSGIVLAATVSLAPTAHHLPLHVDVLCRPYEHITTVRQGGVQYVIRNDNYGHFSECLGNTGHGPNFAVLTSGARVERREPVAYPNIFLGCSWGVCSPDSGLPQVASRLRTVVSSWHAREPARGVWSAGYDVWFARHRSITGQDTGAEIMIWLDSRGSPLGHPRIVKVGHTRWYLSHWVTGFDGKRWNYVQFRRVRWTSHVSNLDVLQLIDLAERDRLVSRRWWLTSLEAGFEIWRGGAGLATTGFGVRI